MNRSRYTCELFADGDGIDPDEWAGVCDYSANPTMDPRFLSVLSASMQAGSKFWAALVRDGDSRPVAATYLSLYPVDGALFLHSVLRRATEAVRQIFRRYLYFRILICGQPVGVGQSSLQWTCDADVAQVAAALDAAALELAKQEGAGFVVFKEFPADEADRLAVLQELGYSRGKSVLTYQLASDFDSFDAYYESRSKRTRANMRKYFAKLEAAAMSIEHRRGGDDVPALFTDDVYKLYRNVVSRAEFQFEVVPAEFFRELARRFPDESSFTFVRANGRVTGFCCGLGSVGGRHHMLLYCGVDYARNEEAAIYFNTLYRGLAAAMAPGVTTINVGQSADEFKRRLGCEAAQLYIFTKPTNRLLKILHRVFVR